MDADDIGLVPIDRYRAEGRWPSVGRELTRTRQAQARRLGASFILTTRFEVRVHELSKRIRTFLARHHLTVRRIGSSTYNYSVWAVIEGSEMGVRSRGIGAAGTDDDPQE